MHRLEPEPLRRRPPPDRSTGNALKIIFIVIGSILLVGACATATVVGLVFYGVRQARKAVAESINANFTRIQTASRYDRVARAMADYHAQHGHFPPPNLPTKSGKPGLSWRVALLPQMGRDDLYRQFKLDEPWDHPANMKLADYAPIEYLPPNEIEGGKTHLRLFVGAGSMFEYGKIARTTLSARKESILLSDGVANTITFVEATQPVLWIEPNELPYMKGGKLPGLGMPENNWFYVALADGGHRVVRKDFDAKRLEAAITAAGGEITRWDEP